MRGFFTQVAADVRFYAALRYPHSRVRPYSLIRTLVLSRGLWLLICHRIAYFCFERRNLRDPRWWIARLVKSFGSYRNAVLSKSEIHEDCHVPGSVYLSEQGYLICGAQSIGPGTLIHSHVTFGYAVGGGREGRPVVGANVWIGPHCIVAGALTIGDGSTLLPGTYLTFSVPPGSVVRGNPSRVVLSGFDNSTLRQSLRVVDKVEAVQS